MAHYSAMRRAFLLGLLLTATFLVGACGQSTGSNPLIPPPTATPLVTATPTPAPSAHVIGEFSSPVTVLVSATGTVSSTCPPGDPLLGGGFIVESIIPNLQTGYNPIASYPSSAQTWTVSATSYSGSLHLTAVAACLVANFPATIQVAQATNSLPVTSVSCPAGSQLTGGGFKAGGGTNFESEPNGSGWEVDTFPPLGGTATPTVYAMCATQGLTASLVSSTSANANVEQPLTLQAGCPAGELPVGSGFNGWQISGDTFWHVFRNEPVLLGASIVVKGWLGSVYNGDIGPEPFKVYIICAKY